MSLEAIIALLTTYKYLLLFPIVIVEGPIITVIAGFLSSLGQLNFFISYAIAVVGDVVGDCIYYALGFYGRQKFVWYNFIATLPKSLILLLIGFYFGETYAKINTYLDYTAIISTVLAVLSVIIYFAVKKISQKYGEADAD